VNTKEYVLCEERKEREGKRRKLSGFVKDAWAGWPVFGQKTLGSAGSFLPEV
jgi:hypothetical protein